MSAADPPVDGALPAGHRGWVQPLSVVLPGLVLGSAAFLVAQANGRADGVLVALVSSGFSWGLVALVIGYTTREIRHAPATGSVVLIVATVLYYVLIVFVSRRWALGLTEDGGSASGAGLRSVARATAFWLLGSIVGGALLGHLGHAIRRGSVRYGAVAAGVALALLAGEGAYHVWEGAWSPEAVWSIGLAVAMTALMFAFRRGRRAWWVFAGSGLAAVALSVLLWIPVEQIRTYDF